MNPEFSAPPAVRAAAGVLSPLRAGEGPDDMQNSEERLRRICDRRHPRAKCAPS